MSLFVNLSNAARSMEAQRAGLTVTGENIANLNTPGYVRRRVDLVELPSIGGVDVAGVRAMRDRLLEARLRQELPAEARDGAVAESLSIVETSFGAPGASLDAELTAFFDSFASLAQDPTSPVARDGVLQRATTLANSFNNLAASLDDARRTADAQIRGTVDEINRLADQLADLNVAIGNGNANGVETLRDQQSEALAELSKLADIRTIHHDDGTLDVTIGQGRPLVVAGTQYALVTGDDSNGFATISLEGVDITTAIDTGKIGGLMAVRDTYVPSYQTRLDALAFTVAGQVNTLHQTGTDLYAGTANNFFTPIATATGAAAAISVDAAVLADSNLVAASATGAPGDNGIAKAISQLRDARVMTGGATMFESWGQLVYRAGSDTVSAETQAKTRKDIVTQVSSLLDQVQGVSLDEEAATMLRFQRGYEANAKFFSTVDSMLDTLMRMVGV